MASFFVPNSASIHTSKSFLIKNDFFSNKSPVARLEFHPKWMHIEPIALSMIAAWGAWCNRNRKKIKVYNLKTQPEYAARMHLFDFIKVNYTARYKEHEESGRFLPLRCIKSRSEIQSVMGDISAMLHLDQDQESLAATQYCLSELLRNVCEHANSEDGAFICAHNFRGKGPHRITMAVADCGIGIRAHLSTNHPDIKNSDRFALQKAMTSGVTGASPGMYGSPENAGAGLFITRSIAKTTGGYFEILSGNAVYRLRRNNQNQLKLFQDPFLDSADIWELPSPWNGTVVTMEIRTDRISNFKELFSRIRVSMPERTHTKKEIRFT